MNKVIYSLWLLVLLFMTGLTMSRAQTLTLYNGIPGGDPEDAFDGNVFYSGNQYGDAYIYAVLSAGAGSFQIFSPAERQTKTVTATGAFNIRPTASMIVDKSKILNFSGTVTGSVAINVKPLSITTISANVATIANPGSELTISYFTGSGTYPVELALGKFKVQLLDSSGNLLNDLLYSTDQYAGRESFGSSHGGIRYIKATIPAQTNAGIYRVRVVTQGLETNVIGSASSLFTIGVSKPTITAGSVGTKNYCAGTTVSFPFTTTGTFPTENNFRVQLTDTSGTIVQNLPGSNPFSPVTATLPSTLAGGSYIFKIISTSTEVVSTIGSINISALPTMTISGNLEIQAGATAPVTISFTGTSPWTFDYTDYRYDLAPTYSRTATFTSSSAIINPTLYVTTAYNKNFIRNFRDAGCGTSSIIDSAAYISVTPITLTTGSSSSTYCPGSSISVPFTVSGALPFDAICQVQISNADGNFQNGQIIGTGGRTSPILATIPQSLSSGNGYKLRVILQQPSIKGAFNYNDAITAVSGSLLISRPSAPTVADISFCQGSQMSPLSASGSNLKWFVSGVTQPLPNPPTPPNDRSSQYFVSQTINGCESALSTINVNLKTVPTAPSVTNVTLCQGGQGQFSTSITGALWYTSATGGTGSSQPPSLSTQTTGNQTVYVTQTVNGCESPRATVIATVYPIPPVPTFQTPSPICQYGTASPLSALGQNLIWYDQSGKLVGPPTPETSLSGTKSYSVSQTVNGCESPRALVNQVIRSASANPIATGVRYCVNDVPRSLTANGTNLKWYSTPTGGTSSPKSPAFFTETANTFTFYVTQTDSSGCESQRLPVSVSVVAAPSAPTVTTNQVVCQFAKVSALIASPATDLIWQGPGITGTSDIAPTPITAQPATYTYTVTQKAGSCTSLPSVITFTVRKIPDAPSVVSPAAFCIGQSNTTLSATAVGQLTWYTKADHSGFASSQIIASTSGPSVTTYYVTQTDSNKCESLNSELEVRVSAKATARLTGDGNINPGDSTAIRVRLTGDGPWTFTNWESKSISTFDSLYVKWEKPTSPRTYAITNLKSTCGTGDILNSYTLLINPALSTQSLAEPLLLKAYPNPTTGDVFVEWSSPIKQEISLQIINTEGKIIKQVIRQSTNISQTELFQLGNQPIGTYILRCSSTKNGILTRPIVKH